MSKSKPPFRSGQVVRLKQATAFQDREPLTVLLCYWQDWHPWTGGEWMLMFCGENGPRETRPRVAQRAAEAYEVVR